jgi:hypothetical protein
MIIYSSVGGELREGPWVAAGALLPDLRAAELLVAEMKLHSLVRHQIHSLYYGTYTDGDG